MIELCCVMWDLDFGTTQTPVVSVTGNTRHYSSMQGASVVMVACTTWPARAKQPFSGFKSHRSHIGLLFFPSSISRITKVSLHFFPLGFSRSFP